MTEHRTQSKELSSV